MSRTVFVSYSLSYICTKFMRLNTWILIISVCTLSLTACKSKEKVTVTENGKDKPFRKVSKGDDYDEKFLYAEKYFTNGDFYKAQSLYEEIIPHERLTERGKVCYYRYAQCHYEQGDYYLAGYYFKNFHKNNPADKRAEDALFTSAMCKVRTSPEYSLDQTDTENAINELQLFLDRYPQTKYVDTCNVIIDQLTDKLDKKKYEVAMLAYRSEKYKAAVALFDVCLEEFPQSDYKELILFHSLKASHALALNSVPKKKKVRFEKTIKSYYNFVSAFPESVFMKEANGILKNTQEKLERLTE